MVHQVRYIASRVTAPDAELYAICAAIVKACSLSNVDNITLFTDSIASARQAMNPSVHSGQGHSLAVCRALEQWFANGGHSVITRLTNLSEAYLLSAADTWQHPSIAFARRLHLLAWTHGLPCSRTRNTGATTSCCSRTLTEVSYSRLMPKAGPG